MIAPSRPESLGWCMKNPIAQLQWRWSLFAVQFLKLFEHNRARFYCIFFFKCKILVFLWLEMGGAAADAWVVLQVQASVAMFKSCENRLYWNQKVYPWVFQWVVFLLPSLSLCLICLSLSLSLSLSLCLISLSLSLSLSLSFSLSLL